MIILPPSLPVIACFYIGSTVEQYKHVCKKKDRNISEYSFPCNHSNAASDWHKTLSVKQHHALSKSPINQCQLLNYSADIYTKMFNTPCFTEPHSRIHHTQEGHPQEKNISLFLSIGECDWMVAGVPEGRGGGGLFLQEPHVLGLNSDCWVSVNIAPFWQQPPVPHQNPFSW